MIEENNENFIKNGMCCVVSKEVFLVGHRRIKSIDICIHSDCLKLSSRECHYCEEHCNQSWRDK